MDLKTTKNREFKKRGVKITNYNNYIYFSIYSAELNARSVSAKLGVQPISVKKTKTPAYKITSWQYKIDVGEQIDLEKPLAQLIDVFENKIVSINQIKEEFNALTIVQFVINIDLNPESSTPYFGLNNSVIDFLNKTNTTVDFDLCKADTLGIYDT